MRVLAEGTVDRAVVLFGSDTDPGPELTWARGITLLSAAPAEGPSMIWKDVGAQDDQDPSRSWKVGSVGGLDAIAFAARHAALVDRLVLIGTPIPEDEAALGFDLSDVTAKTLLLYGAKDPLTGSRHGNWWQRRIPDARLEMVPDGGAELLVPMWNRILSHLAPHCKR